MQLWGVTAEQLGVEPAPKELALWSINATPVAVFQRVQTQWLTGPGGPIGLNYQVLPMVLRFLGVPRTEHPDVFEALRVCESEALAWFAEQAKKE